MTFAPWSHPHCDKTDVQPFHLPRCSIICNFKKFKLEDCKCIEMVFFVYENSLYFPYIYNVLYLNIAASIAFSSVFCLCFPRCSGQIKFCMLNNQPIPIYLFKSSQEINSQSAIIRLIMLTLLTLLRCLPSGICYDY